MIEDVKNLLIETLDSKGILGQIRAQLRSSVFKAIDEQDNKYGFGFKWENPTLYKIIGSKLGILSAELIREFMESHRMDYSLSTFIPESSISPEKIKKEEQYLIYHIDNFHLLYPNDIFYTSTKNNVN